MAESESEDGGDVDDGPQAEVEGAAAAAPPSGSASARARLTRTCACCWSRTTTWRSPQRRLAAAAAGARARGPPHTVLLDLDARSSPASRPSARRACRPRCARAPRRQGSALNPGGVFVVERPGLPEFLLELAAFAEVVVFTAGLREYAEPIIDAIDPSRALFAARVYREGTTRSDHYQCVKDMRRAGRALARTVLVDDTPLARSRGRATCGRCSSGASTCGTGSGANGYPESVWAPPAKGAAPEALPAAAAAGAAATLRARLQDQERAAAAAAGAAPTAAAQKEVLLLVDFDKTLTDFDAGERLVGELAPELAPQLAALQMPANFVPLTNDVLSEMQRRGVGRDALLAALQRMGAELPACVLSDCNTLFIGHVLAGARLQGCVQEVISNSAAFERVAARPDDAVGVGLGAPPAAGGGAAAAPLQRSSCHRLVVAPRRGPAAGPHGCPLCPSNLCKGDEVAALSAASCYRRVVFAGDGANDICPALRLGPADAVLARRGHALAAYLEAAAAGGGGAAPAAAVHYWETHDQLAALVELLTSPSGGCGGPGGLPN
ncbi:MAG: hypothetical protein J3K34DRAFT_462905 [Monoraphidium minutum]|nr:MAG: hypothetical protein J3K34DRAFT_462905 [Monoraphidium minutum]